MIEAFFLGLGTGTYCVTTCLPLILPFTLADTTDRRSNIKTVFLFLAGRLGGYISVGLILGAIGAFSIDYMNPHTAILLKRISYPAAGVLLLTAGLLYSFPKLKFCRLYSGFFKREMHAGLLGLVTAFSLCPPFFAAAARVFGKQSTLGGGLYFLFFFLGTTIWFLPLFGLQFLNRIIVPLKLISRTAMILIGGYYIVFMGILGSI